MKTNLITLKLLLVSLVLTLGVNTINAKNWFVKPNASGTGASWDDPCNISVFGGTPAGLADGEIVYIGAGTYTRSTTLSFSKYVTVMGGYDATSTGTDISKRNLAVDSTLIKPVDGNTTARGLSIAVTTIPGFYSLMIDGLTFEGFNLATGNAGAAVNIANSQGDITFKNCNFLNNIALNTNGGAVYMGAVAYNITTTFDNCLFRGNQSNFTTANGYGGAFYCNNGTTVAKTFNFTNCLFKNNTAYGRAGAIYGTTYLTCNITDCYFDTNYCTNPTDNTSSGGAIYIAGGTQSNTVNMLRSIFVNSSCTAKGSVIWFNTTPKNTLNITDCSLIGNYATRKGSARAAIDADNFTTNLDVIMNNCVLSNFNNTTAGVRQSKYADLMNLTPANCSTSSTFTNTILNGAYFGTVRNNTYDAVQPDTLYSKTHGYLDSTTIVLAMSGDLKITNKIVFKKTFTAADLGTYTQATIFDVKAKLNIPMTLIATVPTGYVLTVDGTDYSAGVQTINIAASATAPTISFKLASGLSRLENPTAKVYAKNGIVKVSNIETGNKLTIYNAAGQILTSKTADANETSFAAKGFVLVKISSATNYQVLKVISE